MNISEFANAAANIENKVFDPYIYAAYIFSGGRVEVVGKDAGGLVGRGYGTQGCAAVSVDGRSV